MTPSLIAFGIVHVASIAIMLAFVALETGRPDKERRPRRKALRRPKAPLARRGERRPKRRASFQAGSGTGEVVFGHPAAKASRFIEARRPSRSAGPHLVGIWATGVPPIAVAPTGRRPRGKGALCHEHRRSTRRCATVLEMKEGPSGSAIRSLIPSHRERLWSKATVVSVAETSGP